MRVTRSVTAVTVPVRFASGDVRRSPPSEHSARRYGSRPLLHPHPLGSGSDLRPDRMTVRPGVSHTPRPIKVAKKRKAGRISPCPPVEIMTAVLAGSYSQSYWFTSFVSTSGSPDGLLAAGEAQGAAPATRLL